MVKQLFEWITKKNDEAIKRQSEMEQENEALKQENDELRAKLNEKISSEQTKLIKEWLYGGE